MACGMMLIMITSMSQTMQGVKQSVGDLSTFKYIASDLNHLVDDEQASGCQKSESSSARFQSSELTDYKSPASNASTPSFTKNNFDEKSKHITANGITYHLMERLGGGSFGETWLYSDKPNDVENSKTIAVKMWQFKRNSRVDACKRRRIRRRVKGAGGQYEISEELRYNESEDEENARFESDHEESIYTQLGCFSKSQNASKTHVPQGLPAVYTIGRLEGNDQSDCKEQHGTLLRGVQEGVEYDFWWLAMERMDRSLGEEWRRKQPEKRQVASVASQVLDILKIIHGKGLVYRDLKSENLMYGMHDKRDQLHFVDMGLATNRGDVEVAGTPWTLSYRGHRGMPADSRDDYESLLWMLLVELPLSQFKHNISEEDMPWSSFATPATPAATDNGFWNGWVMPMFEAAKGLLIRTPKREDSDFDIFQWKDYMLRGGCVPYIEKHMKEYELFLKDVVCRLLEHLFHATDYYQPKLENKMHELFVDTFKSLEQSW
eukprot:TRINITY_DN11894_c0_g1_i1.p1 TRINITY_DN11894_c0_g1~~TRINITY_DN11894_c0_g1_i1.p1  ORF type:complete len:491 (+),score=59.10 TRINITY_DN11894_c0_g1_i1:59-1531(+)